ncbi:MAG TPA: matrixin family metalloprotease [Chthoniobacterales bacterium]|nr:matrixin family metalloprotease [Chthoniobacterales bacterium]
MKFALLAMVAAVAGFSTTSPAYVLHGRSWPTGTVLILQLNLGTPGFPLEDGSPSWNAAVAPAATMWSQNILRMQVASLFDTGIPASSGDQLNSVVFASTVFGQPFGGSTLAVTYYRYSGSTMVEADILFNQARTFDSYRGPLQFPGPGPAIADIRRVFLHELGHALGLGHPDSGGQQVVAVMNSIMSNQEVLSADDIAGGQSLYGAPGLPTPTPTPLPTPPPSSPSHLSNISTRVKVGVASNVLIGGFMVSGTQPKKVILRAIGPSLADLGLPGAIADPVLELHGAQGLIATNDDWQTGSQMAEILASGLAPADPLESAIIATLGPGNYTAVVSGYLGGQGIGLVEAYEFDSNTTRLVNISTRGRVGVGNEPMIGGLIVQGSALKRVIVRALGPSLGGVITGVLADPILALHDGNGNLLAENDDWSNSAQAGEIIATTIPPSNNLESAIIAVLGPGSCTAIVRGVNNTTGVGLVEVYDLNP